jgi:hypothetical protein
MFVCGVDESLGYLEITAKKLLRVALLTDCSQRLKIRTPAHN